MTSGVYLVFQESGVLVMGGFGHILMSRMMTSRGSFGISGVWSFGYGGFGHILLFGMFHNY